MSEWKLVKYRGCWAVRIGGSRYTTGVAHGPETRVQAEGLASEIARQYQQEHRDLKTVGDIAEAYFEDIGNRTTARGNAQRERWRAGPALEFFGGLAPAQVTREACRDYIRIRREEGSPDVTILNNLGVIRAALRWQDKNTPAQFEMPSRPPRQYDFLTPEQIAQLVEAAPYPHAALFIQIAYATAARLGAILEMHWDTHISFERREIWPGFKEGGKGRAEPLPMTDSLYQSLAEARELAVTPYVIEFRGGPIKKINKALGAAYKAAGIDLPKRPAHILRHSAAVQMTTNGVDLFEIKERLGHSSIRVTEQNYARFRPDRMKDSTHHLELPATKCSEVHVNRKG